MKLSDKIDNLDDQDLQRLVKDQPLLGRIAELYVLKPLNYIELIPSCLDPEIWRSTMAKINETDQLRRYLDHGLEQLSAGLAVPFLIRLAGNGIAVGSTRLALSKKPGVVEIGWTFIAPAYHRSGVNIEAKLLLLDYAFGALASEMVVFKVASSNDRSKASLAKLGATPFVRTDDSGLANDKDINWFRISLSDWPSCRCSLKARLPPSC